jgi:three-Cys-motif partner protein
MAKRRPRVDRIGIWSEIKLEILKEYAKAYSTILARQPRLYHIYVDAFAGAGVHLSRSTGELVPGSPLNALAVTPAFREYHLIDLDRAKVESLSSAIGNRPDVHIYQDDCNDVLLRRIFPGARWEDYRRALCLLDPYGLSLDWRVVESAGRMKSIDLFLNFPMEGINRDALWRNPADLDEDRIGRMTRFWGAASWKEVVYSQEKDLFGGTDLVKRPGNEAIVRAYQERLGRVAGFPFVPDPMPMRNSKGAVVYYLFFASHNQAGDRIARHIFRKYRSRGRL